MNRSERYRASIVRPAAENRSQHRAGRPLPGKGAPAGHSGRASYQVLGSRGAERRRAPLLVYGLVAVGIIGGLLVLRALLEHRSNTERSASRPARAAQKTSRLWVDPQYVGRFQDQLQSAVGALPGRFSVVTVDLQTGTSLSVNSDQVLRAASVNKLELVVELYRRAAQHLINLDAQTMVAANEIQNYGTGTIQLSGPGTYTYRELARLLIVESDNTAAYVLEQRMGLDSVQADVNRWGLTHTSIADNMTTASDVALLLTKLARRELLSDAMTSDIVDLLEHTVWNDRLQSGVPSTVEVAHKIGTDVGIYNDAALISPDDHPYVVVVLGSDTQEDAALAGMTDISRLAYTFEGGLPAATRTLTR